MPKVITGNTPSPVLHRSHPLTSARCEINFPTFNQSQSFLGEDAEEESGPKKDIASPRKDMASPRKDITLQDDPTSDVETVPPKGCKNDGYNSNKEMGYTRYLLKIPLQGLIFC